MNAQGSPQSPAGPRLRCPDCRAPLPPRSSVCPPCGLLLVGDTAQRLWQIDTELTLLDNRKQQLRDERAVVVKLLRRQSALDGRRLPGPGGADRQDTGRAQEDRSPAAQAQEAAQAPAAQNPAAQARETPAPAPAPAAQNPMAHAPAIYPTSQTGSPTHHRAAPTGEVTRRSAQNIILGLGGLLIGIAALVFAVWTWSDMSTGARAGVLGLTTLAFALTAHPLHRRGLQATAETFGALTAALLCIDALSLWLLLSDRFTSGTGYAAAALAAIGALMLLYPLLVPLRTPRIIAVLFLQPVPVLLVASVPVDGQWPWMLPAVAATALADLLVVHVLVSRTGPPREGVPLRTLHVTATVLWVGTLCLAVLLLAVVPGTGDPVHWWTLAVTLLLSGMTGLLFSRRPHPSSAGAGSSPAHAAIALLTLGAVPLAAGPARLPVLPRIPSRFWDDVPGLATAQATRVLELPGPGSYPSAGPLHLAAVLIGAALAVGAVVLLRRDVLVPAIALVAPPTLLAFPLLLGLPYAVAVVWALLLGAALVLGTALLPHRRLSWVPATTGSLTLLTGLAWSLPDRYVSLAALLLLGATALVALLLSRRTDHADGPSAALYGTSLVLWSLTLLTGASFLLVLTVGANAPRPVWWLLAAATLLTGATALLFGRVPNPFAASDDSIPDVRAGFTLVGLLLMPTAPLLVVPGNGSMPSLFAGPHEPWSAPVSAMLEPAHAVLGLPAQPGVLAAIGTAIGVSLTGALVVALVVLLNRRWTTAAVALTVPSTLVPLPIVLGAPYTVAVVWTMLVGAALVLSVAPAARRGLGWVPAVSGLATLALGLVQALPEWYTTLIALVVVAAIALAEALVLRRLGAPQEQGPVPLVYAVTLVLGVLTLLVGLVAVASTFDPRTAADPVAWWFLGMALLSVAAAAMVVGQLPYLFPAPVAPVSGTVPSPPPHPAPSVSPFTVVGMLLAVTVPLIVGPRSLPALAVFSQAYFTASAPPAALLDPAHAFLGQADRLGAGAAAAVAAGVLLSGLLAVGLVALLARRWTPHTLVLVAPPALVPLPIVLGAPFFGALVWTLAVGSALVLCSASARDHRFSWLPGLTGLLTLLLGLSWALAEEYTGAGTLMVVAVVGSMVAALARTPVPAIGATAVATAMTGAFALALPLALDVPVEYAALAPIAMVAAVASAAPRIRGPLLPATEIPACLWAAVALSTAVATGARLELVALALGVVGVIALATAVRPNRRLFAPVGGLLMFCALWTALAAWDVTVPEAYTVPPALAALVIGREWFRKADETPSSWAAYGGGLALLLLPTVGMVLSEDGMVWRLPAVLAVGLAVTLWGLHQRLQAALVLGGLVLVTTSLRAFGPPLWDLTRLVPNWVPFAVTGVLLLVIGARYESGLARLRRLGRMMTDMR